MPHLSPKSLQCKVAKFITRDLSLQLDVTIDHGEDDAASHPTLRFSKQKNAYMLGEGVVTQIHLEQGQAVSFVFREDTPTGVTPEVSTEVLDLQQHDTQTFWFNWISQSKYTGRWHEVISRSLLILKLLTFEPTGAIIAAPTFSLPENIGGSRCATS